MEEQETALGSGTLDDLLAKVGISGEAGLSEEPVTLHRRGHWFEPSIAHHIYNLHNVLELFEYILTSVDPGFRRRPEMSRMSN